MLSTCLDCTGVLQLGALIPLPVTLTDVTNDEQNDGQRGTQQCEHHQERETVNQTLHIHTHTHTHIYTPHTHTQSCVCIEWGHCVPTCSVCPHSLCVCVNVCVCVFVGPTFGDFFLSLHSHLWGQSSDWYCLQKYSNVCWLIQIPIKNLYLITRRQHVILFNFSASQQSGDSV